MLINKNTAISTQSILLVPYEEIHVPTYHEWMKDEEIQKATASEPLSLQSEHAMQKSWRSDHDKLTFIACLPLDDNSIKPEEQLIAGDHDSPSRMIGDVNLFLSLSDVVDDDDENQNNKTDASSRSCSCTGELEIMIAPLLHRRRGYGKAAISAFMQYISLHMDTILAECAAGEGKEEVRFEGFRVKIGVENERSLRLFEGVGFVRGKEGVNYFGEVELWFGGDGKEMVVEKVEGYREVAYVEV